MKFSQEAQSLKKGVYEHYKKMRYRVIGVAHHSETLEEMVIYKALYGDGGYWIRPLLMFMENVHIEGKDIPRFTYISE